MLTTGAVLSAASCVGPMPTRLLMTCTGPGSEASRSVRNGVDDEPGGRMPVLRKPHSWSVQLATTEGNAGGLDAEVGVVKRDERIDRAARAAACRAAGAGIGDR